MRYRVIVTWTLCVVCLATARGHGPDPDAGKSTGNVFESTYFKFHYSFPQGWSAVDDELRAAENRKRHEESVKIVLASQPADPGRRTQVYWIYDLLIASPKPLAAGEELSSPRICISAMERGGMFDEPGEQAKLLSPSTKILRKPEHLKIAGHKFMRTDLVSQDSNFEALFETVSGKYLVKFEFWGNRVQEIESLSKTMDSLHFD